MKNTGFVALVLLLLCELPLWGQVAVSTGQYNILRTNANPSETILNSANVNPIQFGLLYSRQVDGEIYAQPLYIPNVSIRGMTLNVVYVATMHNSVYAFAADQASASAPLWQVNLGPSAPFNTPAIPEDGILSTPVIDPTTGTLYAVALTLENGSSVYRLHALDITSGAEKFNGPVVIQASVAGIGNGSQNGVVTFSAANHWQRSALLLGAGSVVIAFGTNSSQELQNVYHGWVLGYDAKTLQRKFVFNTTPNGQAGGIWMSGVGPAGDATGFYFSIGNGSVGMGNVSEGVVRIGGGSLDYFTVDSWQTLNQNDWDFGASGPLLIPGTSLLVVGGKTGIVYVLNRTNLGQLATGDPGAVQSFQATAGCSASSWNGCNEIHHMAYWSRMGASPLLYLWGWNDSLKAFALVNGKFITTPVAQNSSVAAANFPGGILAVSSNGSLPGSGILWAVTSTQNSENGIVPGVLHAFNASNVAVELWNSTMNAADALGNMAKFCVPTVANGKVFVATFSNKLMVYGLH